MYDVGNGPVVGVVGSSSDDEWLPPPPPPPPPAVFVFFVDVVDVRDLVFALVLALVRVAVYCG